MEIGSVGVASGSTMARESFSEWVTAEVGQLPFCGGYELKRYGTIVWVVYKLRSYNSVV